MQRLVLVHGAATTAAVWDPLLPHLADLDVEVVAPERPRTGELERELGWLAAHAEDAYVVGTSGGATLGLALTATGASTAGLLLHEPAVGSLAPHLLDAVAVAFATGGRAAFGRLLYGPTWRPEMAGGVPEEVTAAELAMFRAFEPAPPTPGSGPVVVTFGARSGPERRQAAEALGERLGHRVQEIPGAGHFAAHDAPAAFAAAVRSGLNLGRGHASAQA